MTERATGAIVPDEVIHDIIDRCRTRIDDLDQEIIESIQERRLLSVTIRRRKQRIGQSPVDVSREKEIIANYVTGLGVHFGPEIASAVLHYSKDRE